MVWRAGGGQISLSGGTTSASDSENFSVIIVILVRQRSSLQKVNKVSLVEDTPERKTLLSSHLMPSCDVVFKHLFSASLLGRTLHELTKDTKDVFEYD